jgi:L-serine/L-threonine ammonia-lyase
VRSIALSQLVGKDVFLKLDALQASGSFKDRGMAHLCHTLQDQGFTKLVSSSGGNAGLAVATIGKELDMKVSVIVPETTKSLVVNKLRSLGADVKIFGENWNAADRLARQRVEEDPTSAYISPYDNPLLWTGHSSMIDEIVEELPKGQELGAIVVSVGGGGLICGVLEGLHRRKLHKATVIAAETDGADCFGQAWTKGEMVVLPAITSVATSLGALQATPVAIERAKDHEKLGGSVLSSVCTDAEAVYACVRFAQDHRLLVEPACGAALAIAYSERLRTKFLQEIKGSIVLEICGGSGVNIDLLKQWESEFLA